MIPKNKNRRNSTINFDIYMSHYSAQNVGKSFFSVFVITIIQVDFLMNRLSVSQLEQKIK